MDLSAEVGKAPVDPVSNLIGVLLRALDACEGGIVALSAKSMHADRVLSKINEARAEAARVGYV